MTLEKNQLQLTVSAQVDEQLAAARSAIAQQYEEQLVRQKQAQLDEVASLQKLIDGANAKEAELQAARTALILEKNQLQLTVSAQVDKQLAAARSAIAQQYEEQLVRQKQAQLDQVASLKAQVERAAIHEQQTENLLKQRELAIREREDSLNLAKMDLEKEYLEKWESKQSELVSL